MRYMMHVLNGPKRGDALSTAPPYRRMASLMLLSNDVLVLVV